VPHGDLADGATILSAAGASRKPEHGSADRIWVPAYDSPRPTARILAELREI
jgi:hypothetical protein